MNCDCFWAAQGFLFSPAIKKPTAGRLQPLRSQETGEEKNLWPITRVTTTLSSTKALSSTPTLSSRAKPAEAGEVEGPCVPEGS